MVYLKIKALFAGNLYREISSNFLVYSLPGHAVYIRLTVVHFSTAVSMTEQGIMIKLHQEVDINRGISALARWLKC